MKRLVVKFGGTALSDTEKIRQAAKITVEAAGRGYQVAAVVSAMGHTTDHLLSLVADIEDPAKADFREVDLLLATGEQAAAALMALAIKALGARSCAFTGRSAGIVTDRQFGNARIEEVKGQPLEQCLSDGVIPVIAGFQGITADGETTTLGRGGSDTTALAIAGSLGAERCDIYTDVDGIYSADPHILPEAFKLSTISFEDMLELARSGAQVLNARSAEIAAGYRMPVRVRSAFAPGDEGTLVTDLPDLGEAFTGIACSSGKVCFKLSPAESNGDRKGVPYIDWAETWQSKLKDILAEAGIAAEIGRVPQALADELSLWLPLASTEMLKTIVGSTNGDFGHLRIRTETAVAAVSIVGQQAGGSGMEAVYELMRAGIPVELVSGTERRLSVLVPEQSRVDAVRILHARLFCRSAAA